MIRIDRTKIGDVWRDRAFQMTIGYVVAAVIFAFIASSQSQFRHLFLMVPVALLFAGVMAFVFVQSTNTIIIYDNEEVTAVGQLEGARQEHDQILAWRVQDIIAGLGLTHTDFSIGGGWMVHVPEVVSVVAGPPVGLDIRTLPGQTPDDFAAHAPAIAYNLGMAGVQVVPLGPSLIRLNLLPGTSCEVGEAA